VVHYLLLQGATGHPRTVATWEAKEAILACGGFVLGAHVFSNKAVVIQFEIPSSSLSALVSAIVRVGIRLFDESAEAVPEVACRCADEEADIQGQLHISFVHGEPDEKTEVPSVPG